MPVLATLPLPLLPLPQLLPATPTFPPPPLSPPWELPLLPSLLSEELTLVLDVTSPTLLESSMSPRGRLRLRLMLTTVPMVLATPVLATLVWDTLDSDTLVLDTLPLLLPLWPLLLLLLLPSLLLPPMLPSTLLALPLLPSLLSEELTLVLDVMSPTLLELSMLPRGRLRPMLTTVPMVLATLDSDTLVWATAMPVLAMPLPLLPSLLSPLLLPATPTFPPPPLSPPWELPLLPSLLSEELMPVLDGTSPTLLESSMLLKKIVRKLYFVGLLIK